MVEGEVMEEGGQDEGAGGEMEIVGLNPVDEGDKKKKYEEREYQIWFYDRALERNIIICLPTGAGKTFIAVKVILHYLKEALKNGKKIIFIAPTVPLAHQQGKYMRNHIGMDYDQADLLVKIVTGDMQPEDWDGTKWDAVLSEFVVFSMTPQILKEAVERGRVRWDKLALLVLDECHNATKNHPMACLMSNYRDEKKNGGIPGETLPRVLGLTATIVIGSSKGMDNPSKIKQAIEKVEDKLCCKAVTYPDYEDILRHATNANTQVINYLASASSWKMRSSASSDVDITKSLISVILTLKRMENYLVQSPKMLPAKYGRFRQFQKQESPIKEYVKHVEDILEVFQTMGPYCAENCILMKKALITYESLKEEKKPTVGSRSTGTRQSSLLLVQEKLKTDLDLILLQLRKYMSYSSAKSKRSDWIVNFISPKMKKLVEILETLKPQSDAESPGKTQEFCGIIFCEKRIITQMVFYFLKELSKEVGLHFDFIKPSFCLGTSRGKKNCTFSQTAALKMQIEVLKKFKNKTLNLLVATRVLEEGLDVPDCNFIIRYDPIVTYQSFIQSMGRARKQGAKFFSLAPVEASSQRVIMVGDPPRAITLGAVAAHDEAKKLEKYKAFCLALSEALVQKCDLPDRILDDDKVNSDDLNKIVPPFRPNPMEPQMITAGSAISIVYRYCDTLNTDRLTTLSPCAIWHEINALFQVMVLLPPNSCVREVKGPWHKTKMIAKKAAFLEVCKILYDHGMLHEKTLLPIPRNLPTEVQTSLNYWLGDEKSEDGKKVGSKNRVQWHKKRIPQEFCSLSGRQMNVYAITFAMTACYLEDPDITDLMDFGKKFLLYGIVSEADLTKVPDFLLLSRDGNYSVSLKKTNLRVTPELLQQIGGFQRLLFSEDPCLLNLNHIVLDRSFEKQPYYITPLIKSGDGRLDFALDIMHKLQDAQGVNYDAPLTVQEIQGMDISPWAFRDALIVPSYSPVYRSKEIYCVLSVETSMTPDSPFPDPTKAATYAEYFMKTRGIMEIVHKDQSLLKAKPIARQLNYLVAKYQPIELSRQENQDARHSSQTVTVIPELMRIHPLPATLYAQAKFLPSCLHRMHRLLLAAEIGDSVSEACGRKSNATRSSTDNLRALKEMNDAMMKKAHSAYYAPIPIPVAPLLENPRCSKARNGPDVEELNMFTLKRKLLWVEIEYHHPKDLTDERLFAATNNKDESEDDTVSPPVSPSNQEKCQIQLIDSKDVPCENFDQVRIPKAPLTTTILQTMTLANAQDAFDLEDMEMIGDSVLKLIVTLNLYTHFPTHMEGPLTAMRSFLVSNRTLYMVAKNKGIAEYVAGSIFLPDRTWLPPGQQVPEKLQDVVTANDTTYNVFCALDANNEQIDFSLEKAVMLPIVEDRAKNFIDEIRQLGPTHVTYTHARIGDKSIADCVESLIGAYYLSGGIPGALNFMKWLGHKSLAPKKSDSPKKREAELVDFLDIKELPKIQTQYPSSKQSFIADEFIKHLEKLLDYTFKEKWLIVEAFTHQSYQDNKVTHAYQRLEFLGDAVLDFLITHHIYNKPNIREKGAGQLTSLRSALVNNVTFGSFAVRYNLHRLLLHFSPQLHKAIEVFVGEQEKNGHTITGLVHTLRRDDECILAEDVDVPKALGDIIESLAGAVFLDSGMSLDTTWRVFYRLMKHEIDLFSENIPKSPLQQLHERYPDRVRFQVLDIKQPYNNKSNDDEEKEEKTTLRNFLPQRVVVELTILPKKKYYGCGWNKKSAKVAAAKHALNQRQPS